MTSKKKSAREKQIRAFKSQLAKDTGSRLDDIFAYERQHQKNQAKNREAVLQKKTCTSKNRYVNLKAAEAAAAACEEHGTRGLHIYRCPYCDGWHLTSKP